MQALLYAIEGEVPVALPIALPGGDGDLYEGLELGVYSALRTFEHCKFLELDHHLERTRRSMARLGWQYAWDEARLRRCLDTVCVGAAFEEMRVRFDVLAAPGVVRGTQSRDQAKQQSGQQGNNQGKCEHSAVDVHSGKAGNAVGNHPQQEVHTPHGKQNTQGCADSGKQEAFRHHLPQ